MAYAIIGGLDKKKWRVIVDEVFEAQRTKLEKELGVETVSCCQQDLIKVSDVIVLATKPQTCKEVFDELKKLDLTGKVIVSIMAGITMDAIAAGLGHQKVKIVRTMPNTPLLVKLGVTGVYTTDESAKKMVDELLSSTGIMVYVKTEDELNAVTAVSGSGPAYFFAFIEALIQAGVDVGLDAEIASKMAIQTALGAATLAKQSKDSVSTLRKNVTSKGGTTEQALLSFERSGLTKVVHDAAIACRDHGRKMSSMAKL